MTIFRSQLSIYEIQTGTTLLHPPYKANMYYHSSVEVCVCVFVFTSAIIKLNNKQTIQQQEEDGVSSSSTTTLVR